MARAQERVLELQGGESAADTVMRLQTELRELQQWRSEEESVSLKRRAEILADNEALHGDVAAGNQQILQLKRDLKRIGGEKHGAEEEVTASTGTVRAAPKCPPLFR